MGLRVIVSIATAHSIVTGTFTADAHGNVQTFKMCIFINFLLSDGFFNHF